MLDVDKSKGYLTETTTYFGRHYDAFQTLENELKKEKHDFMSCLVIGPGIETHANDFSSEFTRSYQPFELANTLIKSGVNDYSIEILDINPKVISEFQKRPAHLKIPILSEYLESSHSMLKYRIKASLDGRSKAQDYFDSFFKSNIKPFDAKHNLVEIPLDVSSRLIPKLGNVILDDLPVEKYDVVICTVLLSHYSREMTREWIDPINPTLKKIENSIKPNRYLIDTEKSPFSDSKWESIDYHYYIDSFTSIHPVNANLFRKK
jgi:hypothetical protein